MDVRLPDGTVISGVPDNITKAELSAKLKANGYNIDDPAKPDRTDFEAGRNKPGWQQGLASVVNGPLMGFGDEILGAAGGAIDTIKSGGSFTENYRANRDTVRGMQAKQQEENPWTTGITQMMASAPLALLGGAGPAASATRTTGVTGNALRAGTVGAGYGAVGGAGNSTADTAAGVAADTAKGAAIGFGTSAVAQPVIAGMGSAGQNVMNRLSEASAAATAREKVAQALSRDARGTVFTSGQANPINQVLARQNKLGPEATIVDAAGKNTNQLLDTLATLPGQAKDSVAQLQRQRTAGVGPRLRDAADDALGANGQRLAQGIDGWVESRRLLASPMYEQVYQMRVQPTSQLERLVRAAEELGAGAQAQKIATANRSTYSLGAATQPGSPGSSVMNNPTPATPAQWGMRDLDYLKQGLDDIVQANTNDAGRLNKLGFAVNNLRKQLVGELDNATTGANGVSPYRIARETYAGPSAMIDAANKGRLAINRDDAAINSMVREMSPGEMEAFRLGAFEGLRGKLGTQGGQTNIINMWKEPSTREKLRVIFGDERSFREFASAAAREGTMKRMQSVGAGSQTASRQAGMGDLDMNALGEVGAAVGSAKTGNVLGMLGSARSAWNRVGTPEPVRNEMARILMSRGADAQQNLNRLSPLIQQINERNALTADGVGLVGSQIGNRLMPPIQTNR